MITAVLQPSLQECLEKPKSEGIFTGEKNANPSALDHFRDHFRTRTKVFKCYFNQRKNNEPTSWCEIEIANIAHADSSIVTDAMVESRDRAEKQTKNNEKYI